MDKKLRAEFIKKKLRTIMSKTLSAQYKKNQEHYE